MILTNTVENEAVLSNVSEVGEFRIRNSAKAFNILSSGLYSNKIKAIIRELSCNAYDSHVAAGKKDLLFDVHLPSSFEPWFSVRDYGVGLNHHQVVNIYTTYFESTKTTSNEFVGALGLGSKSPFSYTENFIVTAIKDGRKGIYSAFVNDQGIPSIALMSEDSTDEPTGVEIKFSVNKHSDFYEFKREAVNVYQFFKTIPNVSYQGNTLNVDKIEYESRDIIPGVHYMRYHNGNSVAVMGNIGYPIEIPNMGKNLDEKYRELLSYGLEINFEIGELDFQASREGLSYITMTVDAIKNKLDKVNDQLNQAFESQLSEITNLWDQAIFIQEKSKRALWRDIAHNYITKVKHPMFFTNPLQYRGIQTRGNLTVSDENLNNWNVHLIALYPSARSLRAVNISDNHDEEKKRKLIDVRSGVRFCINEKGSSNARLIQSHFDDFIDKNFYVLTPVNKKLPMKLDEFFKAIHNPPDHMIVDFKDIKLTDSESVKKEKKKVAVLQLRSTSSKERDWDPVGTLDSFDDSTTYYYVPLNNQTIIGDKITSAKFLQDFIYQSGLFSSEIRIFGIRKSDLKTISQMDNWVHVDQMISDRISNFVDNEMMEYAKEKVDSTRILSYNYSEVKDSNSPIVKYVNSFKGVRSNKSQYMIPIVKTCCKMFNPEALEKFDQKIKSVENARNEIFVRYPMLSHTYNVPNSVIIDYINMVDTHKGV
jgi:hypothetical protein